MWERQNTKKLQSAKMKLFCSSLICFFYAWIIVIFYKIGKDYFLHQDVVSVSIG